MQDLISFIEQSRIITYNNTQETADDHEDAGSESDVEDEEIPDELEYNLIKDIQSRTQCLMDLVPTLEINLALAGKERRRVLHATQNPFLISEPAHVYISLVREKYKEADDKLVERLGEANWQRHVNVRRNMDEISTSLEPESTSLAEKGIVPSVLGPSMFYDSGIGTSVFERAFHQAHISSGASHSSFISSNANDDPKAARVPQLPAEVGIGEPFRCVYCGKVLGDIKNRQDWK